MTFLTLHKKPANASWRMCRRSLSIPVVISWTLFSSPLSQAATPWSSTATYAPYASEEQGKTHVVTAFTPERNASLRTYTLQSSADQREKGPAQRVFAEQADRPRVRTGSLLFDALFAMALDDARLNSVREIRDQAYAAGRPIACECFETGEKWTWVWTRDLAYAADLGLADLDPQRVVNSLLFKTSGFREGVKLPDSLPPNSLQIIQDTGSGGSWPVSTDRVAWALGAEAVLANLTGEVRKQFARTAYMALLGTIEADREAAFDSHIGLYGGEQSFLDWRDQTYAAWIVDDLGYMAQSKALSTNVVHYRALRLAARLARQHDDSRRAEKYEQWASDLKRVINHRFWLDEEKMYASLLTSDLHPVPVHKFDMLGLALAILSDIAPPERAREVLSRYPHAPFGVPVYYPQQPDTFVYHNRAIWPFVSAYAMRAAVRSGNAAVANHAAQSLMRAAALNLSNMENLEWLTGRPFFDDGPRINSRRQLWSVGAYLGMVVETIFGYHVTDDGLRVAPFVTADIRRALGDADTAALHGLHYLGQPISIVLLLPRTASAHGTYAVEGVKLNGRAKAGLITEADLKTSGNIIEVTFKSAQPPAGGITLVPAVAALTHSDPRVFSPRTPVVTLGENKRTPTLHIHTDVAGVDEPIVYNIYRDGVLMARNLQKASWNADDARAQPGRGCYTAEAVYSRSRNRSHHSRPVCQDNGSGQMILAGDSRLKSVGRVVASSAMIDQATLRDWSGGNSTLTVSPVTIDVDGDYVIRFIYDNHEYAENTGVTNAVKRVRVLDRSAAEVANEIVQMPHIRQIDGRHPLRESTWFLAQLDAGRYTIEVSDYFNMSYLQANRQYVNAGGLTGPVNTAGIAQIRIEPVQIHPTPSQQ